MSSTFDPLDPHAGQSVLVAGEPLESAQAAVILLHGRGSTAREILGLVPEIAVADVTYLAPQAADNTWYPNRFIAPIATNEPWLHSALGVVATLVDHVRDAGIAADHIVLLGFSQGACLALEFAARNPVRYAGAVGLSGALIENGDRPREYAGSLALTPVFLGCSDVDFHIPAGRLDRSEQLLLGMGADVTKRIYPGMGHTVNADETAWVRDLLQSLV
jgi:predicted esterase